MPEQGDHDWLSIIHPVHPGFHETFTRVSLHRQVGGKRYHLGVVFRRPVRSADEADRLEVTLAALCRILNEVDLIAGQQWSGAELLHFPPPA